MQGPGHRRQHSRATWSLNAVHAEQRNDSRARLRAAGNLRSGLAAQGTGARASAELVVLAVLTGALDLGQDSTRRLVLARLADLDASRLATCTVFVLNAASESARQALEALMTTKFKDTFVDRLLAEGEARGKAEGEAKGEAQGEARMILRVLAARGLKVPAEIRQRVLSCDDTGQLEAWGDRAATAASLDEVFSS